MHLAILLVLILIAVLIAPWLIGVAIAAAAIYGVYLVIAAAFALVAIVIGVFWGLFTVIWGDKRKKPEVIHGERKACPFCQCEMPVNAFICKNCGN